ncbi:MAG: Bor family protein [bacterium]|nr:Bor family protein [bacterium]
MKHLVYILVAVLVASFLIGCAAHEYTMGKGPEKGLTKSKQQWYILWGLVPLNNVNVTDMIGDAQNYEVRTAQEPLDVIINIATSYVSVTSRTVTVKK